MSHSNHFIPTKQQVLNATWKILKFTVAGSPCIDIISFIEDNECELMLPDDSWFPKYAPDYQEYILSNTEYQFLSLKIK